MKNNILGKDILEHPEQMGEFINFCVDKVQEEITSEHPDDHEKIYVFCEGLRLINAENVQSVFEFSESPIELLLINSLLIMFLKQHYPIIVTRHINKLPCDIKELKKYLMNLTDFTEWYYNKFKTWDGIDDYLENEVLSGKMENDERHWIKRHILLYEWLDYKKAIHLTMQPRLNEITINNKNIRPDLLIWTPSRNDINIIVECDGYKYHSSKKSFTNDRKRDRVLKTQGFDVLRFSGYEIFHTPVQCATDLFNYIDNIYGWQQY